MSTPTHCHVGTSVLLKTDVSNSDWRSKTAQFSEESEDQALNSWVGMLEHLTNYGMVDDSKHSCCGSYCPKFRGAFLRDEREDQGGRRSSGDSKKGLPALRNSVGSNTLHRWYWEIAGSSCVWRRQWGIRHVLPLSGLKFSQRVTF